MDAKIFTLALWSLAISIVIVNGQFEEGTQQQPPNKWFWNSTTTTASSAQGDSKDKPTTSQSHKASENVTNESQLFSPIAELEGGFLPANASMGRSAILADFISDIFAPANATRGRSSKAMNLDFLSDIGNVREGRILNDDPGNKKLSLQGFIPIVSFSGKDEDEDDKPSSKSPKRIQHDDDLYYNKGPYPPQPIDDEEQTKSQNYYIPLSTAGSTVSDDYKNHRQSFDPQAGFVQTGQQYGARIQDKKPQYDYYIPPPQPPPKAQKQSEVNRYAVIPDKEAVRYITADDYHKRPNYHQQDSAKSESAQPGHFVVSSKPGGGGGSYHDDDNNNYAPAGPYPPEPLPQRETTPKQFRPGSKQFDQEQVYELANGNYIINNDNGLGEDKCICVPFYLCRNGFLSNYGRSLEKDDIDERSARKLTKREAGNETATTRDEKDDATLTPYTADIMARVVGLNNVGQSCGLLRRCCRVPPRGAAPGGLLPFSPDNYQIPHPMGDFSQLPPGILPPGLQGLALQQQGENHQSFIVNQDYQPHHQQQEQHIVVVPQDIHPPHPPPIRRPRPVLPQPKPIYPKPNRQRQQDPHRSRPVNPHRKPAQPVYEPTYQPHASYQPQPSYQPSSQVAYPPPQPLPPHQPVYPGPQQHQRPHKPTGGYPQPDYADSAPQLHQGQCGARNGLGVHGRVNNLQYTDDASEFGEYPWQAAILLKVGPGNNLFVCGGTLVSNLWVATAAHCLKKHHAEELKVRLGDWDVHRDDEFYPYVEKYVTEVVVHPDFYPGNLHNDLALLRLESPVDPSLPHISPACLPDPHERFDNTRCWVTGWGKNAFGEQGEYQSVLKEVDIPMLSHRDCEHRLKQTRLGRSYQLHPGFLCAGGEPGKDACTGDGGSPLVCENHGTWKVAGLVSWGIGCGQPGVPGIYVNMAKYRTWIDTVLNRYG